VTARNTAVMSTSVVLSLGGSALKVDISALKDHGGGEVWLCPLTRLVAVEIGRGENHGRSVTYHNVVRRWLKLGDFGGAQQMWNVPLSEIMQSDIDAAAVMVQQGTRDKPGLVLGAAFAPVARQTSEIH
jgi:hypothetical protein